MRLVSYAYFESSGQPRKRYIENLQFFVKFGVEPYLETHPDVHYLFVIQGHECSVEIPDHPNISVLKTDNNGFDLGAHGKGITWLSTQRNCEVLELPFRSYMFLNVGTRGPFLPVYWPCDMHWLDAFEYRLQQQSNPGAVSGSMFSYGKPTCETWSFMLSQPAFRLVWDNTKVFHLHEKKRHAIDDGENALSAFLIENGYELSCMLYKYANTKWQDGVIVNNSLIPSRPWLYEDINISPFEVIFYKSYWTTIGDNMLNYYECPFETRYTQWKLGEPEFSRVVKIDPPFGDNSVREHHPLVDIHDDSTESETESITNEEIESEPVVSVDEDVEPRMYDQSDFSYMSLGIGVVIGAVVATAVLLAIFFLRARR